MHGPCGKLRMTPPVWLMTSADFIIQNRSMRVQCKVKIRIQIVVEETMEELDKFEISF